MVEGFNSPKIEGHNSQFILFFWGGGGEVCDKSLYLKEDISRGYVHNHCIKCFNSLHNQDLMRGLSFNY